ncbi:MAG TPA: tetratricopeptide repeat protein [Terriglobales bacterium]|nr:tetratricopeptide repeat protein [Terriglobales bacterium]
MAHPTENLQAYDLYLRGRQALAAQRSRAGAQAAIDLFTQALSRDPRFGLAYAGIADASLVQYDITRDAFWAAKARAAADQAAQLDPRQAEVLLARGRVLRATGNTDAAIAELRQAAQLAPNSDQAYRSLGAAYLAAGKPAPAHAAYEKAVQLNPYYWLNALVLGNSEFQLGDYARALAHYRRVTQLAPDNQLGYLNTGAVLLAQGKYQASLAPLQRAVALSPTADGYSNLGVAYFYLHQYAQSVPYFQKAVEMRPHAETDLGNLADALRWSGQTAAAKERYDRAIALAFQELQVNPRDADTMGDLAMYYAKEGNDAEAAQFARRARAIAPDDVALMYSQAVVDALGHRPDAAMAMLRQAVAHGYSATTVRQDPELAALQKRADFAALVGAKD